MENNLKNQTQEAVPQAQPLPHLDTPPWVQQLREQLREDRNFEVRAIVDEVTERVTKRNKDILNEAMTRNHRLTRKKLALGGVTLIGSFIGGMAFKAWLGRPKVIEPTNSTPPLS